MYREKEFAMQVEYFSFKDTWFDLAAFPLKAVLWPFNKHDGSHARFRKAYWNYLSRIGG